MGLRSKVLIILLGMWAIIMCVIYFYSTSTLINDYLKIERNEAVDNIDRTRKTLNHQLDSLKILNGDWSKWDDAYHFMQNKSQAFIDTNIAPPTFTNANMSLILFFKPDGKLFYGLNYDLKNKEFMALPTDLIRQLEAGKTFTQLNNIDETKTGILKSAEGYIILSASPIVTSQDKGPIRGTLVMGTFFNDQQLAALSELTNIKTSFIPLPLAKNDPAFSRPLAQLQAGAPYFLSAKSDHLLYGYTFVYDINQQPIGILRIESPRALYNEGVNTIRQYLTLIMCIGLFFIIVVWLLLVKLIIEYSKISRQKEVETQLLEDKQTLQQMAYYDTLTGLPNRQSFNDELRKILFESQEKGLCFAILFLDADRFKSINDTYGHVFGDQFLIVTAARLQYAIHNKAIATRISGDEFNIIVSNVADKDSLDQLAQNILTAISAPVTIDNITVQHTFSIGISVYPYDGTTIETLRRHADLAMYHAKKQPKNAFCYFSEIEKITE